MPQWIAYVAFLAPKFPRDEATFLTAAIANLNAWNRIAITFRFPPMIPNWR
jgi:hypothetical protein